MGFSKEIKRKMLISVIMPTRNRVTLAVRALAALSRQTFPSSEYEIIVIADSCVDDTVSVLKAQGWGLGDERRRLLDINGNGGPAKARNAGVRLARGKYLAFTDDDCVVEPDWLVNLLEALEKPGVVAVGGRTITIAAERTPLTHQVENEGKMDLIPTCNAACRREAFEKIGGFSEQFSFLNEDTDFSWRLEAIGLLCYAPRALVVHPPRPDTFKAKVRWVRNLKSEFLLAARNPRLYAARRRSPWRFIYWRILVKEHLRYLKAALGDLVLRRRIDWCLIRLALVAARSGYLLALMPRFRTAALAALERLQPAPANEPFK